MKCQSCRASIPDGATKCPYCGTACVTQTAAVSAQSHITQTDHGVDVFDRNIGGILEIYYSDGKQAWSGSGFLISKDGYALTNTHVVTYEDGTSCKKVAVKIKGERVQATIVKLGDTQHGHGSGVDLALIKLAHVPSDAIALRFEDFANVRNGERVFVIGNSMGYGTCITNGIVSDKCRNVQGKMLLMTDCAVNGGNSGGPIFNDRGLVIGVIVSKITDAEGMNFAIPVSTAVDFISTCKISLR